MRDWAELLVCSYLICAALSDDLMSDKALWATWSYINKLLVFCYGLMLAFFEIFLKDKKAREGRKRTKALRRLFIALLDESGGLLLAQCRHGEDLRSGVGVRVICCLDLLHCIHL